MDFKNLKKLTENFSILYVEDDSMLRTKLSSIFQQLFKSVDEASNGEEGVKAYVKYHEDSNSYYDIVISDIQMPKMNGIDLSKKIIGINNNQKILITSAYDDKKYLIDLINIGVAGFLTKPIIQEDLIKQLFYICSNFHSVTKVHFSQEFFYDTSQKALFNNREKIELSNNEIKLLDLFSNHKGIYFSPIDIFNYLHFDEPEKEFSQDSIKSLFKRLRQKLPEGVIENIPKVGYTLNIK